MPKIVVHTDDLPDWSVRKEKLPPTYLGFLRDLPIPLPMARRWSRSRTGCCASTGTKW